MEDYTAVRASATPVPILKERPMRPELSIDTGVSGRRLSQVSSISRASKWEPPQNTIQVNEYDQKVYQDQLDVQRNLVHKIE